MTLSSGISTAILLVTSRFNLQNCHYLIWIYCNPLTAQQIRKNTERRHRSEKPLADLRARVIGELRMAMAPAAHEPPVAMQLERNPIILYRAHNHRI